MVFVCRGIASTHTVALPAPVSWHCRNPAFTLHFSRLKVMNFYSFHIGDFSKSTAHLSWMESYVYRKLLDLYYSQESPLSANLDSVCRLVLATQKSQRAAVEAVLNEFFEKTEDGWVNHRVERELLKMREKIEASDQRKSNTNERMQRHRNLRKWYSDALRQLGVVAPFGIKIDELRQLYEAHCNSSGMDLQREQNGAETFRATAIPEPDPVPAPIPVPDPTPKPFPETWRNRNNSGGGVPQPPDVDPIVWRDFMAIRQAKNAPMSDSALSVIRSEAADAGLTLEEALTTCCAAGWASFQSEWYENRLT